MHSYRNICLLRRSLLIAGTCLMLASLCSAPALAQKERFLWIVDYEVIPSGARDVGVVMNTAFMTPFAPHGMYCNETALEVNLGFDSRWSATLSPALSLETGESLHYGGMVLETRYLITGEETAINAMVHVDACFDYSFDRQDVGLTGVVARQLGRLGIVFNSTIRFFNTGEESASKREVTFGAGMSWESSDLLSVGFEAHFCEEGYWWGPNIALADGRWRWTTSMAINLADDASPEECFQIVSLAGFAF